jgi:outer membrane receptor protein involved in Fe transport
LKTALVGLALLLAAAAGRGETVRLRGLVRDASRAAVPGARVVLTADGDVRTAAADSAGRFEISIRRAAEYVLTVEADGFARFEWKVSTRDEDLFLEVPLSRAVFSEAVTVTAARAPARVGDTPASVVGFSSEDLAAAAASPVDEVLRQVPGFTLFRRSGSRTANPTSQGVSLRGIGGSGASRAAVFDDGIPLNDPFGGWVAWGRVPRAALDRIEVVSGGASALYGGAALSGAIALLRREPAGSSLALDSSYGTHGTPEASLLLSGREGPWGARIAAESFRTDGYVAVPESERGPVDTPFNSRHDAADVTLERGVPGQGRVFLRGSYFTESRQNGTPLQKNDTDIRQLAAGLDWPFSPGTVSLRAFGMRETYHQTFSSIAADRRAETLVRAQTVPSDAWGVSAQWTGAESAHRLVAGLDAREVNGSSDETIFAGGGSSFARSRGTQRTGALFAQDIWTPGPRWSVTAGARLDAWKNLDAERDTGPSASALTINPLPDRSEAAFSPRLAVLYRAGGGLALTASAYRSFRAPTLNELYRSFRLGNTLTLANEDLAAERLSGVEAGAIVTSGGGAAARASFFWMEVSNTIANVTLTTTPALVTRQRQNLGRTRSRGVEAEAEARVSDVVSLALGYLSADSTVESFSSNRRLEGLRVPQVPRHQGSLQARLRLPSGALLSLAARAAADQFEDDENTLRLGRFAVFDALASVPISRALEVFLAAENLLDRRYDIARTPVRNTAPPRFVRGGLRLRLGG